VAERNAHHLQKRRRKRRTNRVGVIGSAAAAWYPLRTQMKSQKRWTQRRRRKKPGVFARKVMV
jgi:hypothetical protein